MDTLVAHHPAAVLHVPGRGRRERLSLARLATPVAIRHVPKDAYEPVPWPLRDHLPAPTARVAYRCADDGGIWSRAHRPGDAPDAGPVTRHDLLLYLSDPANRYLDALFAGTPLAALRRPDQRLAGIADDEARGADVDVDGSRSIRHDGRAEAVASLLAYLDRNVRLVAGLLMVRREPVLVLERTRTGPEARLMERLGDFEPTALLASPDGFAAAEAHLEAMGEARPRGPLVRDWLQSVPKGVMAGVEAALLANSCAGWLRQSFDERLDRERGWHDETHAGMREGREALRLMEARALTGGLCRLDPHGDLTRLREALGSATPSTPGTAVDNGYPTLGRRLDDLHIPLAMPAPPAEDGEALSWLGPAP